MFDLYNSEWAGVLPLLKSMIVFMGLDELNGAISRPSAYSYFASLRSSSQWMVKSSTKSISLRTTSTLTLKLLRPPRIIFRIHSMKCLHCHNWDEKRQTHTAHLMIYSLCLHSGTIHINRTAARLEKVSRFWSWQSVVVFIGRKQRRVFYLKQLCFFRWIDLPLYILRAG